MKNNLREKLIDCAFLLKIEYIKRKYVPNKLFSIADNPEDYAEKSYNSHEYYYGGGDRTRYFK